MKNGYFFTVSLLGNLKVCSGFCVKTKYLKRLWIIKKNKLFGEKELATYRQMSSYV